MSNSYMTKWEEAKLRDNSAQIKEAMEQWKEQLKQEAQTKMTAKRSPKDKKVIKKLKNKAKKYSENIIKAYANGWNL